MVSSAEEAETCDTFNNRKTDIGVQTALVSLDHKQPETPIKTDNSSTNVFKFSYETKTFKNMGYVMALAKI